MKIKVLFSFFVFFLVLGTSSLTAYGATFINALCDVNRDGTINIADLGFVGGRQDTVNPTGIDALADVNQDLIVDMLDMARVGGLYSLNTSACQRADIDNDTDVDSADLAILQSNLGQTLDSMNMNSDLNASVSIDSGDVALLNSVLGCSWMIAELDSYSYYFTINTPLFPGTATVVNSGTEGTIASVTYSIDGGGWTSSGLSPADGSFNGYSEGFSIDFSGGLSEGIHTLQVILTSTSGKSSLARDDIFFIDTIPPLDPTDLTSTSHTVSVWSNDNTIDLAWTAGTDGTGSGVDGYSYLWDTTSDTVPDATKDMEEDMVSLTSPALADGNTHYFHIRTVDNAGNWTSTEHLGPYFIDTVEPTDSIVINDDDTYTTSSAVTLTLNADDTLSGVTEMILSQDETFAGASWQPYAESTGFTLSSGDGTETVYVKYRDAANNESETYSDAIILDSRAPIGSIVINNGVTYITTRAVTLALEATDATSGIDQMMICNIEDFGSCGWEVYVTDKDWMLTTPDGNKTVYAKFKDRAGNESEATSDMIILDTQGPLDSILINSGATYTTIPEVELSLNATDEFAGVAEMKVCNVDTFIGCDWETYATSKAWTLAAGDGTKTVYAKYRDEAGNESLPSSDTIILDTEAPTGTIVINDDGIYTSTAAVTLTLDASDTLSGVADMMICNRETFAGCSWVTYTTSRDWKLAITDGTKTVYVKYRDAAGNESETSTDSISLDTKTEVTLLTLGGEEYDAEEELWSIEDRSPILTGEAEPGSQITITITLNSETITGTVLAAVDGTWSWRPSEELAYGIHEVEITSVDQAGNEARQNLLLEIINPNSEVTAVGMNQLILVLWIGFLLWLYVFIRVAIRTVQFSASLT
jgi:hypothetical protein